MSPYFPKQQTIFTKKMDRIVGRKMGGPLLLANFIMYCIVLGFASWCLDRYINAQTAHPSMGGNAATGHFLTFAILASILGIVSKLAGGNHLRAWRTDSLAAACSSSLHAWAVTALAFGLACKEINIGGWRGWRLRVVEAFVIILAFTQLVYILLLHAGLFSGGYEQEYGDTAYAAAAAPVPVPVSKAATGGVL